VHQSQVLGWEGEMEGGREKKNRTHSHAKCSTVERWFSMNVNCFVKCICTKFQLRIDKTTLWLINLYLSSPSGKKITTLFKEQVWTCSNTVKLPVILSQRQGREADLSPPGSAEVKKIWIYTSTPPIRLHGIVLN
jgi:hypothetical protein